MPIKDDMLVVLLDRISNPGNLGTIIRSCEALKVDGVILIGHSVDQYNPKTIRSSIGTIFSMPTVRVSSLQEFIDWTKKAKEQIKNLKIIGTSSKAKEDITVLDFSDPMILLIGNETKGLGWNLKNLCDSLIKISLFGSGTSLNVSCATSIILYEASKQR